MSISPIIYAIKLGLLQRQFIIMGVGHVRAGGGGGGTNETLVSRPPYIAHCMWAGSELVVCIAYESLISVHDFH